MSYLRPLAFPFSTHLAEFIRRHDRVYVIDQNRDAQLLLLMRLELEPDLIARLRPFLETELAAGRIEWMPSDQEMSALLPVVQERLPTLAAVGELIGFLFQEDVTPDLALLVPKRWDMAATASCRSWSGVAVNNVPPLTRRMSLTFMMGSSAGNEPI